MEALRHFIAVDNGMAQVLQWAVEKNKDVRPMVLPDFDKDTCPHACVMKADEVLPLRRRQQETRKLFVDTSKIPAANCRPPLMEEDLSVLCWDLYQAVSGGVEKHARTIH